MHVQPSITSDTASGRWLVCIVLSGYCDWLAIQYPLGSSISPSRSGIPRLKICYYDGDLWYFALIMNPIDHGQYGSWVDLVLKYYYYYFKHLQSPFNPHCYRSHRVFRGETRFNLDLPDETVDGRLH